MFPPMIADLFPGPSLGRIMGITAIFGGFGAAFGSWFAGYMHDITGELYVGSSLYTHGHRGGRRVRLDSGPQQGEAKVRPAEGLKAWAFWP